MCLGEVEESLLDFFLVCNRVLPFVKKMVIDEQKSHILTNYKRGRRAVISDHFTEYMDIDLKLISEKPERIELFNFKDEKSQNMFRKITSETNDFTDCFLGDAPLEIQIENWRSALNTHCKEAFKKIRIRKKKMKPINPIIAQLINERNLLSDNSEDQERKDFIEEEIGDKLAEESRNIIVNNFKQLSDSCENVNLQQVWKQLKSLWPKNQSQLPSALRNHRGKIVSSAKDIKNVLFKEYKERLRKRPIRPDLKALYARKKTIFKMKMKLARSRKSVPWLMSDLEKALSDLKNNKSRDCEGFINEIFKLNVIGDNLKKSLLIMFNKLKAKQIIPKYYNYANITTVPKKGSKIEPMNQRGIFRVPVIRAVMMRLIYNTKYEQIDKNMSDCQMGARKKKGCKNNIFLINGIIHEVLKSKRNKAIILKIYD